MPKKKTVVETEIVPPETSIATVLTPMDLLVTSKDNNASVEEMTALFELHLRVEENNAKKAFHKAVAAFKAEAIVIIKDSEVGYTNRDGTFTGYKHASLGGILWTAVPALSKHGLSHRWDTKQDNGTIQVTCILSHELGYSEQTSMSAGKDDSGKKNAIQQVASAVTYLQRYTFMAITGLASQEETPDDDGIGSETVESTEDSCLSEADFNKSFPKWKEVIESGRKTNAQLIAFIHGKGTVLAPGHIDLINKVEVTAK